MYEKVARRVAVLMVSAMAFSALAGCATTVDEQTQETPEVAAPSFDAQAAMIAAADEHLSSAPATKMTPEDVYNTVVLAGDPGYMLVDIRSAEHFALGHIQGAVNAPFAEVWTEENLAKLDPGKRIVVVCYTGHTAAETAMFYNMLGYDALPMQYGMTGWTTDESIVGAAVPERVAGDYPMVPGDEDTGATYDLPTLDGDYADLQEAVIARMAAFFEAGSSPTIAAQDLYSIVQSGDPGYQILSIRSAEEYLAGHIEGAIQADLTEMGKEENLTRLDPNKTIVVYCHSGHGAGQITMMLNLLGYTAMDLKFGAAGWQVDPELGGNAGYDPADVTGYPVVLQ